jgi:hypothetical protein
MFSKTAEMAQFYAPTGVLRADLMPQNHQVRKGLKLRKMTKTSRNSEKFEKWPKLRIYTHYFDPKTSKNGQNFEKW